MSWTTCLRYDLSPLLSPLRSHCTMTPIVMEEAPWSLPSSLLDSPGTTRCPLLVRRGNYSFNFHQYFWVLLFEDYKDFVVVESPLSIGEKTKILYCRKIEVTIWVKVIFFLWKTESVTMKIQDTIRGLPLLTPEKIKPKCKLYVDDVSVKFLCLHWLLFEDGRPMGCRISGRRLHLKGRGRDVGRKVRTLFCCYGEVDLQLMTKVTEVPVRRLWPYV